MMYGVSQKMAANVQGLAMAGDFIMSSPEPKPIEKLKLKITTKSQITNVKLKLKLIEKKLRFIPSSPNCSKPNVGCRFYWNNFICLSFSFLTFRYFFPWSVSIMLSLSTISKTVNTCEFTVCIIPISSIFLF